MPTAARPATSPRSPGVAPLAITMGDPAGIGPEIIAKCLAQSAAELRSVVVVGDRGAMARALTAIGSDLAIDVVTPPDIHAWPNRGARRAAMLPLVQVGPPLAPDLQLGIASAAGGRASYDYVTTAADLALAGAVPGIVTAPINKAAWHLAGVDVPGHTELLAMRAGVTDFGMMLANDELRVMLVSIHVALARAVQLVTRETVLRAIRLADRGTRAFGIARPRVAVAGLNPHAGEHGLFGDEERAHIAPAVADARSAGIDASGPFAPDTVFMRARNGEFDVVVAQYHDQGLIPVKYLGLDQGVNITVGLPYVRTSVDHGTAYDIAGLGRANPSSLVAALRVARVMVGA